MTPNQHAEALAKLIFNDSVAQLYGNASAHEVILAAVEAAMQDARAVALREGYLVGAAAVHEQWRADLTDLLSQQITRVTHHKGAGNA